MNHSFENYYQSTLIQLTEGISEPLLSSILYTSKQIGKRIRPRICLAFSYFFQVSLLESLNAAVALELAHTYTLIHDDLPSLDNDSIRRGLPTNHKVYGEAIALLAGDALITLAQNALFLNSSITPPQRLLQCIQILNDSMGARGVIAGQSLEFQLNEESPIQSLLQVFEKKTGAFFEAALLLPTALAGYYEDPSKKESIKKIASLGTQIGTAFQIADDLEDLTAHRSSYTPENILFYMDPKEAQQYATQLLSSSLDDFKKDSILKSQGSFEFIEPFIDEIKSKLETTSKHGKA